MRGALAALAAALVAAPLPAQGPSADARGVAVAAHALGRGHVLAAEDIAYTPGAPRAAAPTGTAAPAPGWTTRRPIAAGEPLRAPAVAPPPVVRAGQPVTLVRETDGIVLRLRGTAAADAPLGGRVAVRVDTRRRLEGVAAGPALVRLP